MKKIANIFCSFIVLVIALIELRVAKEQEEIDNWRD